MPDAPQVTTDNTPEPPTSTTLADFWERQFQLTLRHYLPFKYERDRLFEELRALRAALRAARRRL